MFLRKPEIIDKINHFAIAAEPFLFAVDFEGELGFVYTPEEATHLGIRYDLEGVTNGSTATIEHSFKFHVTPDCYKTYQQAFDRVMAHLQRGDTYLINLTFPTRIVSDCTPGELYQISRAPFKLYVPGQFIVFSPEIFIRIQDHMICSFPMKGTIDAAIPDADKLLLDDEKEFFEHNTIVDLIRNDLSMVSTGVQVKRFRYLEMIRTNRGDLWQMSSEICGNLPDNYYSHLGELLYTLLPAGSVTGAPKEKTVQIIKETETYQRGFYTGIFGFFDGHSLSSAVAIRYIEINRENTARILSGSDDCLNTTGNDHQEMVFKSGGGITALSDVAKEYQELLKKVYVPLI
ncbi:MAG: aminodeoxychorismate synthase component I [Bacteroidales bacterium]|jgi:para-aminobenzoate synthetase component 1|nr:aminodeoxychorismate synthase component I [Bacteroidales bacterium]